ncbi:MAG TPA: superoxide dismutase [Chloroflexia bacterium]|nr:superoxide dismutase [Chloroflexia bacterium]
MASLAQETYVAKDFNLSGLNGISDKTLELHFGLYKGYVTNTNTLNEQISELIKNGKAGTPAYAELTRRLGFEYNGMRLHEYYFGNMTSSPTGQPSSGKLLDAINASFGDFETWKTDFTKVGAMRGVGWAITFQDPFTGRLSNNWVTLHEDGNLAGFTPVLVMDVWEHAFLLDYKPAERPKYIDAFFSNIDWSAVEERVR